MYKNSRDFQEKQSEMNKKLSIKLNQFREYYVQEKELNPSSKFILIVGRTPPPTEKLLYEDKKHFRHFFDEAIQGDSTVYLFYIDQIALGNNLLSIEKQKTIELLYTQTIEKYPLFIGDIQKIHPEFLGVFNAIIFDGGVCFNMSFTADIIHHLIDYLYDEKSFLLLDSDSSECQDVSCMP